MPSALFVTTVPVTLEAFLVPFADRFRSLGWRVDALANGATRAASLTDHFDDRFDAAWSRNPLDPRNLVGTARRVREVVERGSYDIVHVHTPIAAFVTRFALRRREPGRPVLIYTAHGFHFYRGQPRLPHALYRTLERLAAPWTDHLVVINAEDLDAAFSLGIAAERIRLIPGIGVDTARFAPGTTSRGDAAGLRESLGIAADDVMVLMVAEFAPVKRHALVLEALARVADRRVRLVLAGDGPLEAETRALTSRLGLHDRVVFAGYRPDVPALLGATDALVIASEREGLNRSVLEAMATGVPVIGTDTRGITDAVGPDAGWIVPKHDAAALGAALEAAAADPGERLRRGAEGRKRVLAEFSLERILAAYEELYRDALA